MNLKLNEAYNEPGATATDDVDGDLTSKIKISGSVNTSVAGNYTITYTVKDSSKNQATVKRTVIVSGGSNKDDKKEENKTTGNETT